MLSCTLCTEDTTRFYCMRTGDVLRWITKEKSQNSEVKSLNNCGSVSQSSRCSSHSATMAQLHEVAWKHWYKLPLHYLRYPPCCSTIPNLPTSQFRSYTNSYPLLLRKITCTVSHHLFMTLTGINIKDYHKKYEVYHNPLSALTCQH